MSAPARGGEPPLDEGRYALFLQLLDALDEGCRLMEVYDALPHRYGGETLYQAESHTIQLIGRRPGITVSALAAQLQKTPSACSQMVRRLREKGWVTQAKNARNNREQNLGLTAHGWVIFENHERFDRECYQRSCRRLADFTDAQLQTYLAVQARLNESFRQDVERSRRDFSEIPEK